MKKTKTIYINHTAVPVSEAVYRAYWQSHEQARYQDRLAASHSWSLTDLAASGVPEDALTPLSVPGGEADYLARLDRAALEKALATLSPTVQDRLWQLVLGETTERALAKDLGLSPAAIHKRKHRALARLRAALEDASQQS
ncbi:hypothetical protein ACLGL1_05580 [Peptococcus simiae]|uniref:hypothetical protein n=1 Tax=Peptococcus simiae TaxID=1643805 RepID=UPI00398094C9